MWRDTDPVKVLGNIAVEKTRADADTVKQMEETFKLAQAGTSWRGGFANEQGSVGTGISVDGNSIRSGQEVVVPDIAQERPADAIRETTDTACLYVKAKTTQEILLDRRKLAGQRQVSSGCCRMTMMSEKKEKSS